MAIVIDPASGTGWTFSQLKTGIAGWLHRPNDTSLAAIIPDLISFGENRIYRDLRISCMEVSLSSVITAGVLAVPSDYLELKNAYIVGDGARSLLRKDAEWIYANYPVRAASGKPSHIAREGANFIFGPYPDGDYAVRGVYYARLDALSDSNTTNWFTTNASDLLLFAALCEAEPWLQNDARVGLWENKYKQIKDRIQRNDENEEFSGSILSATGR